MKKYINPIINVSLFDAENIVTIASQNPPEQTALEQAQAYVTGLDTEGKRTITVTF